jgi:hypothetical protein
MKVPTYTLRCCVIMVFLSAFLPFNAQQRRTAQPREVLEAFRVCNQYQRLLAKDLDFDRAFAATFTKNEARRRHIALAEVELRDVDLKEVDSATLISVYKSRMQLLYLLLPLISPESKQREELFFPPPIKVIFERQAPRTAAEYSSFALQLKRDVADVRTHVDQLARRDPGVAERIRDFKAGLLKSLELPNHVIKPLTAYSRGSVLALNHEYYQIGDYAVIREGSHMRIVGIRFFSRLF